MATILVDGEEHQVTNDEVAKLLTSLRDEVKGSKILIEEYKAALRMADMEHAVTTAELNIYKACNQALQSLSLWGRIKHSITGLFKGY